MPWGWKCRQVEEGEQGFTCRGEQAGCSITMWLCSGRCIPQTPHGDKGEMGKDPDAKGSVPSVPSGLSDFFSFGKSSH